LLRTPASSDQFGASGEKSGDFLRPKGPSKAVTLAKKGSITKASSSSAKTRKVDQKPAVEKKPVPKPRSVFRPRY